MFCKRCYYFYKLSPKVAFSRFLISLVIVLYNAYNLDFLFSSQYIFRLVSSSRWRFFCKWNFKLSYSCSTTYLTFDWCTELIGAELDWWTAVFFLIVNILCWDFKLFTLILYSLSHCSISFTSDWRSCLRWLTNVGSKNIGNIGKDIKNCLAEHQILLNVWLKLNF